MATYAQFKHVELYKIGHGKNRVPNAPKSCIGEIFSSDSTDHGTVKNGVSRPRAMRDTPTRPRDTHSRLFGQGSSPNAPAPMVTDNIRSHIQFGESQTNGVSTPTQSPIKPLSNGSASSTPSRGEMEPAEYSSYTTPRRNPVTGDGVPLRPQRRRHPAASLRGATPDYPINNLLEPQPNHAYYTQTWPPNPGDYYVESTTKPTLRYEHTPHSLIGLYPNQPRESTPQIDPDSLSPQPILDRHWPPLPGQYNVEETNQRIPHHPLTPHAFIGMTSALGDQPKPEFKYNPVPSLDGGIDPYLISNLYPPPTLMKYEYDGPIPDVSLFETPVTRGPHTLTGFPPNFHKHVPGYLYRLDRHAEDFSPKTYYLDYILRR